MLQALRRFLSDLSDGNETPSSIEANDHRLAAAALLMHAAVIDGTMSDIERNRLQGVIMLRFGLDEAAAHDLLAAATKAEQEAVDLYRFTRLLDRVLDEKGRQHIVEMMWQVVLADGHVTEFEENLIWRAADLLHVPAQTRIELRRRVAESLGTRHG